MNGWHNNLPLILQAAGGGAAAFGALAFVSVSPRCGAWGRVIYRGPTAAPPRVALTFDDGPSADSTERILDTLGEMNAPAAFFVVGDNAQRRPRIVRRMHDEGHVVANHSFDHSHFGFFRGCRYWEDQLTRTDQVIEQITGQRPALFRPPMGIKTWSIARAARRTGHTIVTWTRRGLDGIATTPEKICARLGPCARPGDVLVLHDGVEPNSRRDPAATVAALRPLLNELHARDLQVVRLDHLIGISPYA